MTNVLDQSPREDAQPPGAAHTGRFETLLMGEHEPSLSELWHKVAQTRPRLAPHAQVIRQSFGAQVIYVVEDPAAGHFYRLSESAYHFLGLLDGTCTVDEAWEASGAQLGELAPTQRECVDLLGKLQLFGLLVGDLPLSAEMIAERQLMARRQDLQRRTGRGMAFLIPLVNPERLLDALAPALRAAFSRTGFIIWSAIVLIGVGTVLGNLRQVGSQFNQLLDPSNLFWLALLLMLIRAWHEFGHACACKAMGGRCTEIGMMLVAYVLPFPYCDATSAWRFPEIRRRVIVASGGVIFELLAASLAAVVWAVTEPGLIKTLAFNTVVISGVTTVVFNLNPLLRYDGYYILSDILGAPNLSQRSIELWRFMIEKFAFRVRAPKPPTLNSTSEAVALLIYGALSWPYRLFVTFSLVAFIGGRYLTVGLVLAILLFVLWFLWPLIKGLNYLLTSPRLLGRRGRALGIVAGCIGVLTVVLAIIPMPASGLAVGAVEPSLREPVRSQEAGFLDQVLVTVGDVVEQGQPMFVMRSADLRAELLVARAKLEAAKADLDASLATNPTKKEVSRLKVEAAERDLEQATRAVERLTIRAPIAGKVHASGGQIGIANSIGRYVKRGELFAEVLSDEKLIVRAVLSDREHAYVFRGPPESWTQVRATARLRGSAGESIPARVRRVAPAASSSLQIQAASAAAGGDVQLDPTDKNQSRTLIPQFVVEVEPQPAGSPPATLRPGQFARVRLAAPAEPLVKQWWRRGRQYLAARWAT
jgi:putative peptide zinc metalloprotease protein